VVDPVPGVDVDMEPPAGDVAPIAGAGIVAPAVVPPVVPVHGRPLAPTRPEPLKLDPLPVVLGGLPNVLDGLPGVLLKLLLCVLRTPELVGELVELAALGLAGVPGVGVELVALAPPVAPTAAFGTPTAAPPALPVPAASAALEMPKRTTVASKAIRCLV
jgi:hypothetical protein